MNQKPDKISFFNLPSLDRIPQQHHSLKMINTHNVLPAPTDDHIFIPHSQLPLNPSEDSLAQRISLHAIPNTSKKKKTGCTCKKTFCLKMYCECFSSNRECGQECACSNCKNVSEYHSEIANAKNSVKEGGLRNCSLSEKRCNCKKSHCLKRYCECYNSGIGCSEACKCEGCENKHTVQPQQPASQREKQEKQKKQEGGEVGRNNYAQLSEYKSAQDFQKFYI